MSTSVVASSHLAKSLPPPSGHNARHGDSATWFKGQYATEVEKDEMAILGLLDKADDALWLTRLAALDHLVQVVQSSSEEDGVVFFVASVKMVKLVQRRLGDSHYRVVHAALKLTLALLTASTSTTSSTSLPWKSILPKVFAKAVDVKDSVRLAAESVLNAFPTVVDASALAVAVASTMLDGIPTKVKAVVIAFMTPLVPLAVDVFSNTSFVRSLVVKIVLLVLPEFRAAAADAVDVYLAQTIPALLDVALGCGDADEFKGMQTRIMQTVSGLGQYFVDKTLQLCLATVNPVAQVELLVPLISTLTSTDVQVVLKCLRLALEQLDMEAIAASATTSFDATAVAVISDR
ncbi:hypothetical protein DYB28_005945 [Aphanomyces astaci]|uniref:TOG domain-containing protein n=1 Tax=Aphanomyces astaci TaxID=112090 RepID=A0A9X8EA28_APHAT|nr:hypothetical protein DYB28_005945 [Aphanomyces astaci]